MCDIRRIHVLAVQVEAKPTRILWAMPTFGGPPLCYVLLCLGNWSVPVLGGTQPACAARAARLLFLCCICCSNKHDSWAPSLHLDDDHRMQHMLSCECFIGKTRAFRLAASRCQLSWCVCARFIGKIGLFRLAASHLKQGIHDAMQRHHRHRSVSFSRARSTVSFFFRGRARPF